MAIFRLSKIRQKLEKNLTGPNFGVTVTSIKMYHCAKFGVNPLNNVQNFQSNYKETAKYGYFQTFKKSPKLRKKIDRP